MYGLCVAFFSVKVTDQGAETKVWIENPIPPNPSHCQLSHMPDRDSNGGTGEIQRAVSDDAFDRLVEVHNKKYKCFTLKIFRITFIY